MTCRKIVCMRKSVADVEIVLICTPSPIKYIHITLMSSMLGLK